MPSFNNMGMDNLALWSHMGQQALQYFLSVTDLILDAK